jgi:hypothetical protein
VQQWAVKARPACEPHAMRPWIQYIRTFNVSTCMYACLRYSVRLSRRILRQTEKEGETVLLACVEASELGSNTGFIVTNLPGAKVLYEKVYCARGRMENLIEDMKLYRYRVPDFIITHHCITISRRIALSSRRR